MVKDENVMLPECRAGLDEDLFIPYCQKVHQYAFRKDMSEKKFDLPQASIYNIRNTEKLRLVFDAVSESKRFLFGSLYCGRPPDTFLVDVNDCRKMWRITWKIMS